MKLKLKSIQAEAAACRKAFKNVTSGSLVLHCHHEVLSERLEFPPSDRIAHILKTKAAWEIPLRLRLFRPVFVRPAAYAKLKKADAKLNKADARWKEAAEKLAKAYAKRVEEKAKWQKAGGKWRDKEYAKWMASYVKLERVGAKMKKADKKLVDLLHPHICKNCPWNGHSIFPK